MARDISTLTTNAEGLAICCFQLILLCVYFAEFFFFRLTFPPFLLSALDLIGCAGVFVVFTI